MSLQISIQSHYWYQLQLGGQKPNGNAGAKSMARSVLTYTARAKRESMSKAYPNSNGNATDKT